MAVIFSFMINSDPHKGDKGYNKTKYRIIKFTESILLHYIVIIKVNVNEINMGNAWIKNSLVDKA